MKEFRALIDAAKIVMLPPNVDETQEWEDWCSELGEAIVVVQAYLDAQEKRQRECTHPPVYAMDGSRSATNYCSDCGLSLTGALSVRVLNARELLEVFRSVAREEITASRACDLVNAWLLGGSAREIVEKLPPVTGGVELSQ